VEQLRSSSTLTFARSLFHAAEGKELLEQHSLFAGAVSTYYSLFHLGAALILAYCSHPTSTDDAHASTRNRLEAEWGKRRPCTLSNGERYLLDPAGDIRHGDVPLFLSRELPEIAQSLGDPGRPGTLRDMREFVSYAPRMVSDGHINVLYSGCQYEVHEFQSHLNQHLGQIEQFFASATAWIKQTYSEVYLRILSGDFVLFEFAELRAYHQASVVTRAGAIYRSLCERQGVDWRIYRCDPKTWHTDEREQREQYAPRWEPYAVMPLVRFCAGGDQ
jgi:hypothetical protein